MSKPKGGWEKLKETQKKKKNEPDFLKKSSLSQNNLQNLGILSIESEFVKSLNFEDVIRNFANEKSRKKELCFDKQVDSCDDDSSD
ncbi:hypothetical protein ACI65C_006646 [Semiaphis heraclei]